MANRFIIGRGEVLTYEIPPPKSGGPKAHPYTLSEAKAELIPQIREIAAAAQDLPDLACPRDVAVAKMTLHPAYIAKSFFPTGLLRGAGLVSLGSRTVRLTPRKDTLKKLVEQRETTQIFVAGTRNSFAQFSAYAKQLESGSKEALEFAEIEVLGLMSSVDRIKLQNASNQQGVYEVGLHLIPNAPVEILRRSFLDYCHECGFIVATKYEFQVGGLLFVPVEGDASKLSLLAQFSLMRVIRPMPLLRSVRPLTRGGPISIGFKLPIDQPLSNEPSVAVLDGGLPIDHILSPYVGNYFKSDETAADVSNYLNHGLGVTSALLFGPIEPGEEAQRPYSYVDHFRVLDELSDGEDPYELYRTLGHVEEVLLSRQYQFMNLSLGPDRSIEDDDVHAWTAVIDSLLSDGETLLTVAVGNNGERDHALGFNRVQVPADCVNALSVGATNLTGKSWSRAPYSARGPGRNPGRRKPDVVAFGGSPKEYFHVTFPSKHPELLATMGTSFASPYVLRTAVGIRAVLGDAVAPLTIKALLVHAAESPDLSNSADPLDIGWGRVPQNLNDIIMCGDGVARIIYQGILRPGKFLRAPVPLPPIPLSGNVQLHATFCYSSPVDVQDSGAYTKAGLSVTFRPHVGKVKPGKQPTPKSFFSKSEFRTEEEQRNDLGTSTS
ncbi:hypothetical protein LMORI2_15180 [Limnohabitans sp. MORI2]|uniref:S8 family peptidase n=1 Tax=Limnohabitans sp. MORI2 TaxID=1751150 RepID=UPI0023772EC1|nr:S8 family peptidase [Limnohabitans sp. MORI2]BDU58536.1 hypothetical protein LMORI2_15180 [Limnohabitans sp. MORI2]